MNRTNGTNHTYRLEERETHHRYDTIKKAWITWSNIPKDIEKMKRAGWTVILEDQYGVKFAAPAHAIKIMPAEKKKRQMSEKQRAALAKNRFTSRKQAEKNSCDNNADKTFYETG